MMDRFKDQISPVPASTRSYYRSGKAPISKDSGTTLDYHEDYSSYPTYNRAVTMSQ